MENFIDVFTNILTFIPYAEWFQYIVAAIVLYSVINLVKKVIYN